MGLGGCRLYLAGPASAQVSAQGGLECRFSRGSSAPWGSLPLLLRGIASRWPGGCGAPYQSWCRASLPNCAWRKGLWLESGGACGCRDALRQREREGREEGATGGRERGSIPSQFAGQVTVDVVDDSLGGQPRLRLLPHVIFAHAGVLARTGGGVGGQKDEGAMRVESKRKQVGREREFEEAKPVVRRQAQTAQEPPPVHYLFSAPTANPNRHRRSADAQSCLCFLPQHQQKQDTATASAPTLPRQAPALRLGTRRQNPTTLKHWSAFRTHARAHTHHVNTCRYGGHSGRECGGRGLWRAGVHARLAASPLP
jgi:hypothetical protein